VTTKVLLDTDIGSDIDDAVALAYLLAQPECELLGITTVTGESDKRAMLASVLCRVAGKPVPLFPGCERPLLVPPRQAHAPHAAALEKWPHDSDFPRGQAVEFLRRTVHEHPGEVVLLAIGALTNVALLFAADPQVPALLKALVLMCGRFTTGAAGVEATEWNASGDPQATAIVYQTPVRMHRSIGLEVTCQVKMEADEVRQRFNHDLLRPVLDFAEIWFREQAAITFHDPLAASTIFQPSICQFERGTVEVELGGPPEASPLGMTHWTPDPARGRHEVAVSVNPEAFFEHYFSVFR